MQLGILRFDSDASKGGLPCQLEVAYTPRVRRDESRNEVRTRIEPGCPSELLSAFGAAPEDAQQHAMPKQSGGKIRIELQRAPEMRLRIVEMAEVHVDVSEGRQRFDRVGIDAHRFLA